MSRIALILTALTLLMAGCLGSNTPERPDDLTGQDTDPAPTQVFFDGTSQLTQVGVCPDQDGRCFGYSSWDFGTFSTNQGAPTHGYLNVTWDSVVDPTGLFVTVSRYNGEPVAEAQGTSPLSIHLDHLDGYKGPFQVGIGGAGPASVQLERTVTWSAVLYLA